MRFFPKRAALLVIACASPAAAWQGNPLVLREGEGWSLGAVHEESRSRLFERDGGSVPPVFQVRREDLEFRSRRYWFEHRWAGEEGVGHMTFRLLPGTGKVILPGVSFNAVYGFGLAAQFHTPEAWGPWSAGLWGGWDWYHSSNTTRAASAAGGAIDGRRWSAGLGAGRRWKGLSSFAGWRYAVSTAYVKLNDVRSRWRSRRTGGGACGLEWRFARGWSLAAERAFVNETSTALSLQWRPGRKGSEEVSR